MKRASVLLFVVLESFKLMYNFKEHLIFHLIFKVMVRQNCIVTLLLLKCD